MVGLQEAEKSMPTARDSALGSETDAAEKPRKDADRLNTTINQPIQSTSMDNFVQQQNPHSSQAHMGHSLKQTILWAIKHTSTHL